MTSGPAPLQVEPAEGWVEQRLRDELPGLRLVEVSLAGGRGRTPRALRRRLAMLSDRFRGPDALVMRTRPLPESYRAFYRQIGMDPDADPPPLEAAGRERLRRGGFRARGRIDSALLIALVETGVPVWALDAERLDGPLGIRTARPGERLGAGELANDIPAGRLVVADAVAAVGILFGALSPDHQVSRQTFALRLFAVSVAGVPHASVDEALWLATEALAAT